MGQVTDHCFPYQPMFASANVIPPWLALLRSRQPEDLPSRVVRLSASSGEDHRNPGVNGYGDVKRIILLDSDIHVVIVILVRRGLLLHV